MQGAAPDVSFEPPEAKKPKEIVNFRCDAENARWARGFVGKPGPKFSEVCDWIFGRGRLLVEVLSPFAREVADVMRSEASSEADALRRIVKLGIAAYEKEKKGAKR